MAVPKIVDKYAPFWIPEPNTGCYLWLKSTSKKDDYPVIWHRNKKVKAARIICEETNGPPPTPKHEAAHKRNCCGRMCVNGNHLYWATRVENERDKPSLQGRKLPPLVQKIPSGYRVRSGYNHIGVYMTLEEATTVAEKYLDSSVGV